MIPDYLAFVLAVAALVYSVHAVAEMVLMLKDYLESKI